MLKLVYYMHAGKRRGLSTYGVGRWVTRKLEDRVPPVAYLIEFLVTYVGFYAYANASERLGTTSDDTAIMHHGGSSQAVLLRQYHFAARQPTWNLIERILKTVLVAMHWYSAYAHWHPVRTLFKLRRGNLQSGARWEEARRMQGSFFHTGRTYPRCNDRLTRTMAT